MTGYRRYELNIFHSISLIIDSIWYRFYINMSINNEFTNWIYTQQTKNWNSRRYINSKRRVILRSKSQHVLQLCSVDTWYGYANDGDIDWWLISTFWRSLTMSWHAEVNYSGLTTLSWFIDKLKTFVCSLPGKRVLDRQKYVDICCLSRIYFTSILGWKCRKILTI